MKYKSYRYSGLFSAAAVVVFASHLVACNNESLDLIAVDAPRIAYADSAFTFRVGAPATQAPASTGGRIFRWSISPALPAGLRLDSLAGDLSGTALDTSSFKTYTVAAKGPGGNGTTTFRLRVVAATVIADTTAP